MPTRWPYDTAYARAYCINGAHDLMSGHTRVLNSRHQPTLDHRIAVANAAALDLNSNSPSPRIWDGAGWEFGNRTAGHRIGHSPHEKNTGPEGVSIRHGNSIKPRERDAVGAPRNWILEIHFVNRAKCSADSSRSC
jgi:hypothetical protein